MYGPLERKPGSTHYDLVLFKAKTAGSIIGMNNTKPLWILVAAGLAALVLYTDFDLLPTPYKLVLAPEQTVPAPGSGTAFSVGDGVWMTARHVVNQCDAVAFIEGRKIIGVVEKVIHHDDADLSLLISDFQAAPLPIVPVGMGPARHEKAFLTGFPGGTAREFFALQVENRDIQRAEGGHFPVIVWAERPAPNPNTSYAGMSGGPVFNGNGYVIGVLVGSDNELGRIVANPPAVLREILAEHAVLNSNASAGPLAGVASGPASETGARLRGAHQVMQIYCHVD